ncbi:MAG: type II secretion system F family protein [Armatimonadetes bacterium]|nr:type II secretion system F family protein [Armatimonadota bacterium]
MGQFWYTTTASPTLRETIEASSLPAALLHLQAAGDTVADCGADEPVREFRATVRLRGVLPSIYEQLANLLDEGVPLPQALLVLSRDVSGPVRQPLLALAHDVEQGLTLSEAMARQPRVFRPMVAAAVRAGEEGGDMPAALRALGGQQRDVENLVAKVALPLAYPLTILTWFSFIVLFLVTFITPKFLQLYRELGMTRDRFPLPTQALIAFTHVAPYIFWLVSLPLLALLVVYCVRRGALRGNFDAQLFRMRLPIFGNLDVLTAVARLSSSLALLLKQNVPTPQALLLAAEAADNEVMGLAVKQAAHRVSQGAPLGEALRGWPRWPEAWLFQVASAEAGGDLPAMLERLARHYIDYAASSARMWLLVAGPTIVVALGVIVGWIGFALYSPLVAIIGELSS